mmetsp:Transcript_22469/g.44152  ORF Transcript_22469/g.44152 Transcript_22469/m.44152 type:complete len:229 (-) Transcript_22469:221-907(-)
MLCAHTVVKLGCLLFKLILSASRHIAGFHVKLKIAERIVEFGEARASNTKSSVHDELRRPFAALNEGSVGPAELDVITLDGCKFNFLGEVAGAHTVVQNRCGDNADALKPAANGLDTLSSNVCKTLAVATGVPAYVDLDVLWQLLVKVYSGIFANLLQNLNNITLLSIAKVCCKGLPVLAEHSTIRVHKLDAIVAVRVVRSGHHQSHRGSCAQSTNPRKHSHTQKDRV